MARALVLAATLAACGQSGPPGGGEQCVCLSSDAGNHAGACSVAEFDAGCSTAIGGGPCLPPDLGEVLRA